jgi:hypothetical protein
MNNHFSFLQKRSIQILLALIAVLILISIGFGIAKTTDSAGNKSETVTISTLERIIKVNELSTFTAVYNGIAQVANKENPEEIDYFVSYEARVNAGLDFEKISIDLNNNDKIIEISIPDVYITDVNVDIASLDFIFYNHSANTSTITETAFKACENDVKNECEKQVAILGLAKQNAVNILTALVKPIVEQMDAEYQLVVK